MTVLGMSRRREQGSGGRSGDTAHETPAPVSALTVTVLSLVLLLAGVGTLISPAKKAGADTVFSSGQVFASVGFSNVNVYDANSGDLLNTLTDDTGEEFTTGSAFDASGNFYVTDDLNGDISEFSPDGTPLGQFATGLDNPLSLVFDNQGNLYVGQQSTPYIAEFSPTGQRLADIGPVQTELFGDDWIDLSSDQCTFYYTTESTDILRYNQCTNTQQPNFNAAALPDKAFQLRILANGDVLVADSSADFLLDQNGNVIQSYPCSSLAGCQDGLFAIAVDPSGTSFWTGDSTSGDIWQINLATGAVMQTISTNSGLLFGLSVKDELDVATSPSTVAATPTSLTLNPVSGDFSSPTEVSGVLTDSATGTSVADEPVTFTLNGTESCTGTTDSTGTADCVITPSEPSQSYTLSASFSGDSTQSMPIGADSSSTTFTVTPDGSTVTYTGPTTAVNGQPVTLTANLTTDTPNAGTPLPTKVVAISIGSGTSEQSCSAPSDGNGNVSCTIPTADQPQSTVPVDVTFSGDSYDTASSATGTMTVTEPTALAVSSASGDYSDATTVTGVLTDTITNAPIPGEPVVLTLDGRETCTATTDATGTASCSVTPSEAAGTYALTGSFAGDAAAPLQLTAATDAASFVVTLEESSLAYTGAATALNGQPYVASGVLTSDGTTPIVGRTVSFTLGTGSGAQFCSGTTGASGAAACTIASVAQPPGPAPGTASFASDGYYRQASASATVNLPEGTQLTLTPTTGVYGTPTPLSTTLVNTINGQPVAGEPVTITVNGSQSCAATTNAAGVATCSVSPTEPQGTYAETASFGGDTSTTPQLLSTSGSGTFTVTQAPTTLTYTGTTSVVNGQPATLSGVLSSTAPAPGGGVGGQTVTFTLGSGSALQSCAASTNASGAASCSIAAVNQSTGTTGISVSYSGNGSYQSSTASSTATVRTPTTLSVSAATGPYSGSTSVSGTLTNSVTGQPVANEPVTLTLGGSQTCTARTSAAGVASCTITPTEAAGSYPLGGSFAGDSSTGPQLLSSSGTNTFVVTTAPSTVAYTGTSVVVSGSPTTLSGTLTTPGGTPLSGQPVVLTVGSGTGAQNCNATTSSSGAASCTIANVNQTSGTTPVSVVFGGSSTYHSSGTSTTVIVAAPPSGGGGFVIGDISAGKPTIGTQVNFWGSQLWKTNQFSGVNDAPASMKGYIDNAPSYTCGAAWTSDPGNSSGPPATIPDYMVVVVASSIQKSGSTEYGNIEHLVVVSVAPGYGPAPGHDGYGNIVATLC